MAELPCWLGGFALYMGLESSWLQKIQVGRSDQTTVPDRNGLAFHQQQLFMLLSCKRWFNVVLVPLFVNSVN